MSMADAIIRVIAITETGMPTTAEAERDSILFLVIAIHIALAKRLKARIAVTSTDGLQASTAPTVLSSATLLTPGRIHPISVQTDVTTVRNPSPIFN